jgi:hypothetical protein
VSSRGVYCEILGDKVAVIAAHEAAYRVLRREFGFGPVKHGIHELLRPLAVEALHVE